jgi:hypothetical protein
MKVLVEQGRSLACQDGSARHGDNPVYIFPIIEPNLPEHSRDSTLPVSLFGVALRSGATKESNRLRSRTAGEVCERPHRGQNGNLQHQDSWARAFSRTTRTPWRREYSRTESERAED